MNKTRRNWVCGLGVNGCDKIRKCFTLRPVYSGRGAADEGLAVCWLRLWGWTKVRAPEGRENLNQSLVSKHVILIDLYLPEVS